MVNSPPRLSSCIEVLHDDRLSEVLTTDGQLSATTAVAALGPVTVAFGERIVATTRGQQQRHRKQRTAGTRRLVPQVANPHRPTHLRQDPNEPSQLND